MKHFHMALRAGVMSLVGLAMIRVSPARAAGIDVPPEVQAAEQQRIEAVAKASHSTLAVFAADKAGSGGSGVLISDDGYALTNFHVAQPCGRHLKCGLDNGQLYDAVIVGIDPTGDLALIKLLGRTDFPAAEWGDSDQLQIGDPCFAVGNPFLLATDLTPTVTYGVVSGVRRYQPPASGEILEYTDCIQTDAAINPGNSGGPLFNSQGQLVGINGRGSFEKRGRVNVGVGYAISIRQALNFLGVLRSGRVVDHATLGATATTDQANRVVVTNILASSDAYRRGLRYGNQLVSLAGRPIDSANTFKNVLGILPKGWRVPLSFRQGDELIETYVRLDGVHSPEVLLELAEAGGDEGPRRPAPPEAPPAPLKIDEAIRPVFVARRGYANYHFNQEHQQRVWQAFRQRNGLQDRAGRWTLAGEISDEGTFRITLEDTQVAARLATARLNQELVVDLTSGLSQQLEPQDSGGLYVALHLWRRLLTLGPARYGEVFYWGTAPLPGREGLFDVLVGIHDVVESRFYFAPQDGQLVAMEVFPDSEVDPCELYFDDYRPVEGQQVPHRIEVRYGDGTFGTLKVDQVELAAAAAGEDA